MSDFVPPLERPEWNFFAEACKPLQYVLGTLCHTEIAVAVRSSDLLECCAAKVVNVAFLVSRQVLRMVRTMVAWDDALEFTVFVASDIRHAVRRPFPFDQVGKLRRIPMKVRINHRQTVLIFWLVPQF